MSRRNVIHVVPARDGWRLKGATSGRGRSHETKADAVEEAKRLARGAALGQVVVHKKDGSIQTEHTYGKDPRNVPG